MAWVVRSSGIRIVCSGSPDVLDELDKIAHEVAVSTVRVIYSIADP